MFAVKLSTRAAAITSKTKTVRTTAAKRRYSLVDFKVQDKKNPHITYELLDRPKVGKALDCIADSFGEVENEKPTDPFTIAFDYSRTEWGIVSNGFVHRAAVSTDNLSMVAVNTERNRIEGVMISEDWKERPPESYSSLSAWRPARAMFRLLHTKYKGKKPRIDRGTVIHPLYFTCCRPDSRRQGIVRNLWTHTVKLATDNNYQHMVAEASNETSASILMSLGFKEVTSVKFDEFKFEGETPFKGVDPSYGKLSLFERDLMQDLW